MNKKELLHMRRLKATQKMIRTAQKDIPKRVKVRYYHGFYEQFEQKYELYMRCGIENGILKVALYSPDNLRAEGRLPSYEIFIDRSARRFITYDRIHDKWLTAKVDRLNWPHNPQSNPSVWISAADAKMAADYLESEKLGYEAVLNYQLQLRSEELARRHKKETDPWDADMALTPDLPKDWIHWVDKVGIPENFMFYQYERRGIKTGFCTYCGKDTVVFPDGNEMDIKCCGAQDDCSWTEAVLFDRDGNELCCSEVSDSYDGTWELEYQGRRYVAIVRVHK